jgi:hypothetical protein
MKDRESSKVIMSYLLSFKMIFVLGLQKVHTLCKFAAQIAWRYPNNHVILNGPITFQIKFARHMHVFPLPFFIAKDPLPSIRPLSFSKFKIPHLLRKLCPARYTSSVCPLHNFHTVNTCYTSLVSQNSIVSKTEGFCFVSNKYPAPIYMISKDFLSY